MSQTMLCWVLKFEGTCEDPVTVLAILVTMIFFVSYFFICQFVITEPIRIGQDLSLLSICDSRETLCLSIISFQSQITF